MRFLYSIFLPILTVLFLLSTVLAFEHPLQDFREIESFQGLPDTLISEIYPAGSPSPEEEVRVIIQLKEPPLIKFRKGLETEIEKQQEPQKPGLGIKMLSAAKLIGNKVKSHKKTISGIQSEIKSKLKRDFGAIFEKKREYKYVFNGFAAEVKRKHIEDIRRLPEVKNVFIDEMVSIQLSNSVPQINADDVWKEKYNGTNVTGYNITVAVIDTGIDYTHPDLGNCTQSDFLNGSCERTIYGWDFYNDDEDPMDDHGHGTHCAGIVGANGTLKGAAPDVKFMAYKVLSSGGYGWESDIIEAIENATLMNADVISMSLGGSGFADDAMKEPIDNAVLNGTVVVVAAGNSGPGKDSVGSPASVLSAITVGAVDSSDTIASFSSRGFAYFSNGSIAGVKPDVVAPGVDINSTVPKTSCELCDPSGYETASGTSMSAPHVAGAVALLMQSHPEWSPEQIKSALSNTAVDINQGPNTQGSGRIDVLKAYNTSSLTFPNSLFFVDLANQTDEWNSTKGFNLTNLLNVSLSYNITYQISTSKINVTLGNSTVNLSGSNSTLLNFTLSLNSSELEYGSYYGAILVNISNNQSLRFPFLLFKYTNSIHCPSGMIYLNESTTLDKRVFCYSTNEENLTFVINSSNIIFDCNSSTFEKESIDIFSMPKGVYSNGFSNVTIRNCKFHNYGYGFYLNNTINNTLTGSSGDFNYCGIYLYNSVNSSLDNVTSNYNLVGTSLYNSSNSSITNLTSVLNFLAGIIFTNSSYNLIDNVTLEGSLLALSTMYSCNNEMNNIISTGNIIDIYLTYDSSNNTISNNNVSNNLGVAIYLSESPNNVLLNNSFDNNYYTIHVEGYSLNDFIQDINTSNKVNGKSVYYLMNKQNQTINASDDPGFIGVINSSNITIRDLEIDHSGEGVLFAYTNNSKISNVSISNSYVGVALFNSFSNVLDELELTGNNSLGMYFLNSSGNLVNNTVISSMLPVFSYDVYSVYSNNTFLNTTYSTTYCSTGCEITRQWYLTVNVTNSSHEAHENASVSVRDSFGSFLWSENTSSNGLTSPYVTTEYVENESDKTDFTPHNITVTKPTYHTNSTNFTVNMTMTALIYLKFCQENWTYTGWSACSGGIQTRGATDLNNCGTSVNLSALSRSCGNGGNGGGVTNPLEFSTSFGSVPAGETKTITVGKNKIDITWFQFKLKNQRRSVSFTVTQLENKPSSTPQPSGEVYSYIQINTSNITEENLESAKLAFSVKKEWVENNSINTSLIYLNRYTTTWGKLNTALLSESTEHFNFESETPGFSYFSITGEVISPPQQICTPNSKRCSGNNLQSCDADGFSWKNLEICQYGCDYSALTCKQAPVVVRDCDSGERRCSDNELQECNAEGQWETIETCDYGCLNGECQSQPFVFDVMTIFILAVLVIIIIVVSILLLGRKSSAKGDEPEWKWEEMEEKWRGKLRAKPETTRGGGEGMTWEELERKWRRNREE